jgi:hypothetical protein
MGEIKKVTTCERSAQDDDFVGVLKKSIPNKLALMGLASWDRFCRPFGTKFIIPVHAHA